VTQLFTAAQRGEQSGWDALVARLAGLVWAVARSHRLSRADAADVSQTVWLRLVEHIDRIREPEQLPGWLATTTRNECLRTLRLAGRAIPTDDETDLEPREVVEPGLDTALLNLERDTSLWRAFQGLSARCQQLLRLVVIDDEQSYSNVASMLGMPIGSIGPTRGRCLDKLRVLLAGIT